MPYTVAVSFDTFHDNINLGGDHRATANSRRDNVVAKLSKDFNIVDSFSTGSIPKMTALHGQADLDVMVVLNWTKHIKDKTPTQVLQSVRNSLAEWRNAVRRNGQAVTLSYETWPDVDIVPVSMTTNSSGEVTHYNVPNSHDDTWIKSRPKALAAAIEAKSTECGRNFRRIIKMIKHWNRIHSDYLSSYHIEVLALKLLGGNCDMTPWEVHCFFDKARALLDGPLYYDTGFADDYLFRAPHGLRLRTDWKQRIRSALTPGLRLTARTTITKGPSANGGRFSATSSPHMLPSPPTRSDPIRQRYYDPLELADKVSDVLFYGGAALSLTMPFLDKASHPILYNWGLILFGATAVALFGLGLVARLYLTPRAEDERRKDFLTSACGVDLAQETTVGYYNNDLLKPTERMAAQVLENAYFTKSGALCLLKVERAKIAVYFAVWLVCVLNRDVDLGWVVAASQALFSEQVVSKWIRLEWLRVRAERIFDSMYQLFQGRPNVAAFNAIAFESFAKYESTKSNAAITLSTRIFEANNARWTAEWEAIKFKLKIGSKP